MSAIERTIQAAIGFLELGMVTEANEELESPASGAVVGFVDLGRLIQIFPLKPPNLPCNKFSAE